MLLQAKISPSGVNDLAAALLDFAMCRSGTGLEESMEVLVQGRKCLDALRGRC
jgi:hypothetical protein